MSRKREDKAPIDRFYITADFRTREDAEAGAELLRGLCDGNLRVTERKVVKYGETIGGKTILELFKVPNRSYHIDDIKAHLQESHHSAETARSYVPALVKEGYIYKVGVGTYARKHDVTPTPAVCASLDLGTSVDGEPAGLE